VLPKSRKLTEGENVEFEHRQDGFQEALNSRRVVGSERAEKAS
jgi:hypothetical protein